MRIAIDFDGTLAEDPVTHENWNPLNLTPPLPGAINFIKEVLEAGHVPIIWTCRACQQPSAHFKACAYEDLRAALMVWLTSNGLTDEEVLKVLIQPPQWGKPPADVYLDNKAQRFEGTYPTVTKDTLCFTGPYSRTP